MTVTVNIIHPSGVHQIVIGDGALDKVRHKFNPGDLVNIDRAKLTAAAFIQVCKDELDRGHIPYDASVELIDAINLMQSAQMKLVCALARIKEAS